MSAQAPPLASYLEAMRRVVDAALDHAMPADAPTLITDAARYSLLGGGKRFRPCLTLATAEAVAASRAEPPDHAAALALPGACAVEMVHTYSLIHDDLPAMDDDSLRRGRSTSHVVFGDGLAILAGDALLTEAFAVLAERPSRLAPAGARAAPVARRLAAVARLAAAAGAAGMAGGQAIDLAGAGQVTGRAAAAFDEQSLADMHARKTGALIRAACALGAILTGAPPDAVAAIDDYAREIGLGFQIADDILDVEGSDQQLGKTAGKDAAAGKPTYPALFGLDRSRTLARECVARAHAALARAGLSGRLDEIATWTVARVS